MRRARQSSCLTYPGIDVGCRHSGASARQRIQLRSAQAVVRELLAQHGEDSITIWPWHLDLQVESSGPQQCRIECVRIIACAEKNDTFALHDQIDFFEQTVDGLSTVRSGMHVIIEATSCTVDFVEKQDCWFARSGVGERLAHGSEKISEGVLCFATPRNSIARNTHPCCCPWRGQDRIFRFQAGHKATLSGSCPATDSHQPDSVSGRQPSSGLLQVPVHGRRCR